MSSKRKASPLQRLRAANLFVWFFYGLNYFIITNGEIIDNPVQVCQSLDPSPSLEKFVDELPKIKQIRIDNGKQLILGTFKITQKLHRDLPPTTLYAYGTSAPTASYPGPTLVAVEDVTSYVRWENHIYDKLHFLPIDPTIMMGNLTKGGVPIVTHLHGAEVESDSDGHPDTWYTAFGEFGSMFHKMNYTYPNTNRPSMFWYHDHSFGITRLNVLSGLVGFYKVEPKEEPSWVPEGEFEVPLLVQDKKFFHNGSINFPNVGNSPENHPQWCPEYFGDTIVVNGKVWPYLKLQPRKYRLRFLNGANARVFVLALSRPCLSFVQIGTDGGLLQKPRTLKSLILAPAERIDTIVDFSCAAGKEVILTNSGPAPYPTGDPSFSPNTTNSVMKFIVKLENSHKGNCSPVPSKLREADPAINLEKALVRQLFMTEIDDEDGNPLRSLLSNQSWMDPVTEKPVLGATEVWEFINFTPDAHPMHVHLIQFQVLNQQPFDLDKWNNGSCEIFNTTFEKPGNCFTSRPQPPSVNQMGWKDTVLSLPNFVTRIVVRWTTQDGGPFSFDATAGPGYVWHCHILDHEDNDMMRPIKLMKKLR